MTSLRDVRIVLADDHVMVRESLARVLDQVEGISVVGQVGDGAELRDTMQRLAPDCVVMDYSMPQHNPIEAIQELRLNSPSTKILVLTVHENVHYAVRVLEAGAHGYLIKAAAVDELVDAIHAIRSGNVYVSKQIAENVWARLRHGKKGRHGIESLSDREFAVLQMLGSGKTLQECAKQLGVKLSTVSTYRARVLEKLSLESTNDLIRFAIENEIGG